MTANAYHGTYRCGGNMAGRGGAGAPAYNSRRN